MKVYWGALWLGSMRIMKILWRSGKYGNRKECSPVILPMLNLRITTHDPRLNNCYICLLIKSRSPETVQVAESSVAMPTAIVAVKSRGQNASGSQILLGMWNKSNEDEKTGPNSHSCCRHMRGEEKRVDIACGMCGSLWNVQYVP